jgi:hypothetical protein
MFRASTILLSLFLCCVVAATRAASITAALDRDSVMVGESIGLSLKFDQRPDRMPNFPRVAGLDIQFTGQGNQITIVNGRQDVTFSLNYVITPSKEGRYTIPAVKASVAGSIVSTAPLSLTVTKGEAEGAANRYAFLKLTVPKNEIYVGEVMPIEVQLYYATRAEGQQRPSLASEGFVINKQADPTNFRTQIGNQIYQGHSFKMTVSAVKEGELTLGPAETSLTLLLAQQSRNDFFPDFFGSYVRRPVELKSDSYKIRVLPLPPNSPPGFSGAVGTFTMTADASPRNITAGDPITLKIAISGRGNLDNLKLPQFNWPSFKFYPPNSAVASSDPLGIQGTKSFEQVVSPEDSTVKEIPALQFAFFDPAQKAYRTLKQAAVPIEVKPGTNQQAQPALAAREQPQAARDIVHIKPTAGQLGVISAPLVTQPWFLGLQSIPLLSLIGALLWRKRQDTLANNPRLRRKIQVKHTIARGLAELRQQASANNSEEFFATVFRLLQEQLGERLDLPASAITEAVLDEDLPHKDASAELIASLHSLFQLCNQARYAPVRTSAELNAIVPRVESALHDLQQLPD